MFCAFFYILLHLQKPKIVVLFNNHSDKSLWKKTFLKFDVIKIGVRFSGKSYSPNNHFLVFEFHYTIANQVFHLFLFFCQAIIFNRSEFYKILDEILL